MRASIERLLAKSRRDGEPWRDSMLLIGHLQDVYAAAVRVLDATGEDQLRALGLNPRDYITRLRRCVLLAAAVHDIGKANDHFQGMLARIRDVRLNPQGLRHEWVTVLMLQLLKPWLLPIVDGNATDFAIVEWAVAGHHPAIHHPSPPRACPDGAGLEITFLLGHDDGPAILNWLAEIFFDAKLGRPPVPESVTHSLAEGQHVFIDIGQLWGRADRLWDRTIAGSDDRKLLAAVKNSLIAADIAGSALPKLSEEALQVDGDRWQWITNSFSNRPKPGDLEKVWRTRLGDKAPREFQLKVAASKDAVTFVKAGCGSGKTLAAYMWAAKHHPTSRLYFCYPTTGTATEGFKDYLYEPEGELDELGARLFHSRRDIDFEIVLGAGPDAGDEDHETAMKLESLEAWSTPIVSCTVDTVLGIVQNNRRGLFAWPALAQSAFVFDEIHSYDDRLFGALLRFLRDLPGLPALLMTASLPRAREEALRATLETRGIQLAPIEGPKDLEERPRYHQVAAPSNGPLPLVKRELAAGGKVLWVCNTVARVMDAARHASEAGLKAMLYHSRFRYIDRVHRHAEVVRAFTQQHRGPALAICSQVAEMSLDLKGCTMLVTDLAPVPALIQRLGRLNRQVEAGDPTRPFIVIEPDGAKPFLPYTTEELQAAREWLAKLPESSVSQRILSDKWEQSSTELPEDIDSAWLDGGPRTNVKELRELSEGISVLLREDVDRMLASRGKDDDVGRYVIPMTQPYGIPWQKWCKHKGIPIAEASDIRYDGKRGAEWRKEKSPSPLII